MAITLNPTGTGIYNISSQTKISKTHKNSNIAFKANLKQWEEPTEKALSCIMAKTNWTKSADFFMQVLDKTLYTRFITKPLYKHKLKSDPLFTSVLARSYSRSVLRYMPEKLRIRNVEDKTFELPQNVMETAIKILNESKSNKEVAEKLDTFRKAMERMR